MSIGAGFFGALHKQNVKNLYIKTGKTKRASGHPLARFDLYERRKKKSYKCIFVYLLTK